MNLRVFQTESFPRTCSIAVLAQGSRWLRVLVIVNGVELVLSRFFVSMVMQICIGVNVMDWDIAGYMQERYEEIFNEMKCMLTKVGWEKEFIEEKTPVLSSSGWMADILLKKSGNMAWWKGKKVFVDAEELHVDTDVWSHGIYKIKGVGDVLAGRWSTAL